MLEKAPIKFLESEIQRLQKDLDAAIERRGIVQGNVHHLERRAAKRGGEYNLSPGDKNELEDAREALRELDQQIQDLQRQLVEKQSELEKAKEVETLSERLDEAIKQGDLNSIESIGSVLKSLEPSLAEDVNSKLGRYYRRAALEKERTTPEDFSGRKQAWELVEAHCFDAGDEEGLRSARERLARLFEQQGDREAQGGRFDQAIHFYCQSYEKWCEVGKGEDAQFAQQRVLGKQAQLYERLEQFVEALHRRYDRLELLTQMERLQEAKSCYRQAIKLCARLPGPQRDEWEDKLTSLYVEWLKGREDLSEIQEIADLGRRENRPAIYEPATYALKDLSLSILIPQPLHL